MRAGKTSVAIQTDIVPTKLMKEVNMGVQSDLILYREVGMLTDGSYAKRKEGADECKFAEYNIINSAWD